MSLCQVKREFLKKITDGLDNLMVFSLRANEIGTEPIGEIEAFIKEHMLKQNDKGGFEFSRSRFITGLTILDFDMLARILMYFDTVDMSLYKVYKESKFTSFNGEHVALTKEECKLSNLINKGDIHTFRDIISY